MESFVLFPYKDFIEKTHHEVVFRVPDDFTSKNVHIEKIIKDLEIEELTKKSAKKGKSSTRKAKSSIQDVPLENQPTRL